ncbi:MAG: amino acid ABC transporter substrate-binding protein [Alphaproteobacteria bacterium]|nr:amino acid ABC transporter substrate-binding protein [Alphaproteobacteria bacterium]
MRKIKSLAILIVASLLSATVAAQAGARLDAIKARGVLTCGVGIEAAGFSKRDAQGRWQGFDVDLCRAIAAAILGDPNKIAIKGIDTLPNFLRDDSIDVVFRGLTWTYGREAPGQLRYGPIYFYDGQTFLVPKRLNVKTAADLSGKTICVSRDVEFVPTLQYYFRTRNLQLKAMVTDFRPAAEDAFFAGRCDAMAADASELAEAVIAKAPNPDDYTILPEQLTKEPLAPLMRKGDEQFLDAVRWTIFALINGEELGITRANLESLRGSEHPDIRRFLMAPPAGPANLSANWTSAVIRAGGNYGEIYDRHLGANSRAKLFRGQNRIWSQGGLMYAPPLR